MNPDARDENLPTTPAPVAGSTSALGHFLLYTVSLPERAVRSTLGLAAGAAQEAANLLVPKAFQSSKTYEILVRNSLRFLTDDIGGVNRREAAADGGDDYMARKVVGNFVDLAGLATLHVSPIWIMAIVSDVAYGSKMYVLELGAELKRQGLIDDTSTIQHVEDVLEAVRSASGKTAGLFDTPPLSMDQLKQSLEDTRSAIQSADYRTVLPEAELKRYWSEMREISAAENVSLLGVSGALTLHTLGKLQTIGKGTLAGVQVVGGIFNRNVVGHYSQALADLRERGLYASLRKTSAPYVEAVWNNFSGSKDTWTEEVVTGRAVRRFWRNVMSRFGKKST